ncbi:hypothetical protein [Priestia megaterium]|uniref:hypothetical protein n=1 Tax=Priestia megaterium TaxID=1404 RepID=UPI003EEADEDE
MGQGPCSCKFRLGIAGMSAPATMTVTDPNGVIIFTGAGTIDFSAVQCFTDARRCNPRVNNFKVTFESGENTINLTKGRRGMITCVDNTVAILTSGTAKARGNVITGNFEVDFSYSIDTSQNPDVATILITATRSDGTVIQTNSFTAPISPQTFIGDCNEKL